MVTWLFIGNMIFCFCLMYFYGKIKYEDGFRDGLDAQIERMDIIRKN